MHKDTFNRKYDCIGQINLRGSRSHKESPIRSQKQSTGKAELSWVEAVTIGDPNVVVAKLRKTLKFLNRSGGIGEKRRKKWREIINIDA